VAKRTTYHVVRRNDGDWDVKRQGSTRPSSTAPTQGQAVSRARHLAQATRPAQVVIHRPNGRIREEHTYGKDPYPPEG
jgi:hypothetical protein